MPRGIRCPGFFPDLFDKEGRCRDHTGVERKDGEEGKKETGLKPRAGDVEDAEGRNGKKKSAGKKDGGVEAEGEKTMTTTATRGL
jgi:hypothetical protein